MEQNKEKPEPDPEFYLSQGFRQHLQHPLYILNDAAALKSIRKRADIFPDVIRMVYPEETGFIENRVTHLAIKIRDYWHLHSEIAQQNRHEELSVDRLNHFRITCPVSDNTFEIIYGFYQELQESALGVTRQIKTENVGGFVTEVNFSDHEQNNLFYIGKRGSEDFHWWFIKDETRFNLKKFPLVGYRQGIPVVWLRDADYNPHNPTEIMKHEDSHAFSLCLKETPERVYNKSDSAASLVRHGIMEEFIANLEANQTLDKGIIDTLSIKDKGLEDKVKHLGEETLNAVGTACSRVKDKNELMPFGQLR